MSERDFPQVAHSGPSGIVAADLKAALRRAFEEHPEFYEFYLASLEKRDARDHYEELAPHFGDAITVD